MYDWNATKESAFTKELQEVARKVIGKDIKISWFRIFESLVLGIIVLTQLMAYVRGEWYTLVTMPLAYWVWSVNIYHDATHFAFSWNWKINKIMTNLGFMFCTPYIWYH